MLLKIETSHYCGYTENLEKLAEISIWFFFAYFIPNAVVGPESIAVSKFYLQFNKLKPQGKMLLVFHLEKANIIIEQITAIRLDDVLTMWDSLVKIFSGPLILDESKAFCYFISSMANERGRLLHRKQSDQNDTS